MILTKKTIFLMLWLFLAIFWIVLNSVLTPRVLLGSIIIGGGLTVFIMHLFKHIPDNEKIVVPNVIKFMSFIIYLLIEMLKSNLMMALWIILPMKVINPVVIELNTTKGSNLKKMLLANSITLVPTSLYIDEGKKNNYFVHCLNKTTVDQVRKINERIEDLFK